MKTGPPCKSALGFLELLSVRQRYQKRYHSIPIHGQQEVIILRTTRTLFGFIRLGSGSGLGLRLFRARLLRLPCSRSSLLSPTSNLPLPIIPLRRCQKSLVSEGEGGSQRTLSLGSLASFDLLATSSSSFAFPASSTRFRRLSEGPPTCRWSSRAPVERASSALHLNGLNRE